MRDNFTDLTERISEAFAEIDSDIVIDMKKSNEDYENLQIELANMKQKYPFIEMLLEEDGAISLTAEEHEIFASFIRLYMEMDNMERQQIYFRGHTDGYAYLKRIGVV